MGTMTLVEFLLARIADEEAVVREYLATEPRETYDSLTPWLPIRGNVEGYDALAVPGQRLLLEAEGRRRLVRRHYERPSARAEGQPTAGVRCAECMNGAWPCFTLRILAHPYAEHPDYLDEWRP